MPTVVLDVYSKAFPSITNRLKASIFLETDLLAPVATIIEIAPHPVRIWHFPGLPRANYAFSLDEIDGGGAVISNKAYFDVVPGMLENGTFRGDEQIKVDTTPGFDADESVFTFDGSEISPGVFRQDYRGWQITPSELTGRGILARGLDYSWDEVTGILTLLQVGDVTATGTYWNIHFDPIQNTAGGSLSTINDFTARVITGTSNIELTDFGNTVILEPESDYMNITLPDILTVAQGRILTIESKKQLGDAVQCSNILPFGADVINFLRGRLSIMNNESLQIYRYRRADDSDEWRVRLTDGNFKTVGQSVPDDQVYTEVYSKQLCDGSSKNKFQFGRYYNEVVLELPAAQVVDYDDWATGNNKYLHSLANSANPIYADQFHFPDRRDLFERNNLAGKAGDYEVDTVGSHVHPVAPPTSDNQNGAGRSTTGNTITAETITPYFTGANTGTTETRPKNNRINKNVLI